LSLTGLPRQIQQSSAKADCCVAECASMLSHHIAPQTLASRVQEQLDHLKCLPHMPTSLLCQVLKLGALTTAAFSGCMRKSLRLQPTNQIVFLHNKPKTQTRSSWSPAEVKEEDYYSQMSCKASLQNFCRLLFCGCLQNHQSTPRLSHFRDRLKGAVFRQSGGEDDATKGIQRCQRQWATGL